MRPSLFAGLPLVICLACESDRRDGAIVSGDDGRSSDPALISSSAATVGSGSAAASSSSAGHGAPGRGLANKDNDAVLVADLRSVLVECKTSMDPMHFLDPPCEPFERLKKRKLTADDAGTWVEVLFDPDPAARRVAGYLLRGSTLSSLPPDVSGKIVTALEQDLGPSPTNTVIASVAIELDVREVGARLVAIGKSPKTPIDVRSVLAMWWRDERSYEVTAALANEASQSSRLVAMAGYARSFRAHQAEACAYWAGFFTDPDADLRKGALRFLSGSFTGFKATDAESDWYIMGGASGPDDNGYSADWCPDQIDGLLDAIEQRVEKRDLPLPPYLEAAGAIADHLMATAPQRKRATAILKRVVADTTAPDRDDALTVLVETFPSEIAYAGRFTKDESLSSTVARLKDRMAHIREMFESRREAQASTKKRLADKKGP